MSEQGLEVLETTYQKTQEWIGSVAQALHPDKGNAYKALRAVLQPLRDRLPLDEAVHFGGQLPMLLRGLYYEGWKPSQVSVKMSAEQFLKAIKEKIVSDRFIDPIRTVESVLQVIASYVSPNESDKVMRILPKDLQAFWPTTQGVAV
jgi:uncharacterized protein (DUF2267 family)